MRTWSNDEVAGILERFGGLLRLSGENPFRARAYLTAADAVRHLGEPVVGLAAEGRLREVGGIGEGMAAAIREIIATDSFAALDTLSSTYPPSLLDLLALPGIGPKTALRLHREFGLLDLAGVEAAVSRGTFRHAKGLGPRFEAELAASLQAIRARTGQVPIGVALPAARALRAVLRQAFPGRVEIAGGVRRFAETVDRLAIVVEATDLRAAEATIEALPLVSQVVERTDNRIRVRLQAGHEADIFLTSPIRFGTTLLRATGSTAHVERLGQMPDAARDEAEVYAARALPWIPPELRSGGAEFDRLGEIPGLIDRRHIQGELHSHSTWSDGTATIGEMAAAAAGRAYEYLGVTDHSRSLGVANGLDVERLRAQRREIDSSAAGIVLLQGAEVEVARDGSLDYDDATLASLDVVVASLHSGLRQDRATLTRRLLRVLDNPNVDIIAHPSGRLIERRQDGDFDWDRVFIAAAARGTALEVNADPSRLDLNAGMARDALAAGCLLSINCDAHNPQGFALIEYGIAVARQAWATPDRVINAWPLARLREWLATRGRRSFPDR